MSGEVELHRVAAALPEDFPVLRAEAREEGYRFIERLVEEWDAGVNRFDRRGEALFVARQEGVLAGVGGLTIDPVLSDALRMRRFYVRPSFRRCGVGRTMALGLVGLAHSSGRIVTVNAGTAEAPSFWEALGFIRSPKDGHTHFVATRQ